MLNSFWGKFGQRPNQTQVSSCTKPSEFFQIITDDRQVIHRIEIVNEHMVEVFHNFQEKTIPVQTNVNIFIACFTTSYARLKLYDALDTLQERVLYFDTDSVIYTKKPTQATIPTGNYLGQFTNELDEGDHIVEFVAAGPKNYAYNTKQGKQTCKVRGFTFNARGKRILHFNSIKYLNQKMNHAPFPSIPPIKSQDAQPRKLFIQLHETRNMNWCLINVSLIMTHINHFPMDINVYPLPKCKS